MSFALLLNLVGVANASSKAQLWAYFAKYLPEATPGNEPLLDLAARLKALPADTTDGELIQAEVYAVGRAAGASEASMAAEARAAVILFFDMTHLLSSSWSMAGTMRGTR